MKKSSEKEIAYNIYNRGTTLEESINVINKQEQEIARLKCELNAVKKERDLLIIEVSKLKFDLEIADNSKKLYSMRRAKDRNLLNCMNGSVTYARDCHNDCDDDEEVNSDIDDVTGEDFNDNFKSMSITDSYQYQWHRPTSNNNSIRNNSSELVNYSRNAMSYELSQDLLEKQIELLERKYGGTRAREAAITIQRAFRRYQLIKKFTHITEMVKAEKGSSRRFQENGNAAAHANEYACEAKNAACLQANVTPIRSLSMREKRLGELESGSNSLPRGYVGRCTSCTYCCNMTNSCSPCCLTTPSVNLCPNYVKQNHSNSPDMVRNYHQPHLANCSSTSPIAFISYPSPTMNNNSGALRKYSGHFIYHNTSSLSYQLNSSGSPLSQVSTPKKVPPEVPKRTSSISFKQPREGNQNTMPASEMNFSKTKYSGSMSSVQSSSSDSSSTINASHSSSLNMSNNCSPMTTTTWSKKPQVTETVRKRQYRVGLNLFNKKPERGITYLVLKGFLEDTPQAIAKFLIHRKGLSKETIGEYLGGRNQYNQTVLECYMSEIDLSGMQVDVALRKFVTYFKLPGEAQKIERLMKAFSDRYCRCNRDVVSRFEDPDTVFVLAFAIIMLNSDQHTRSMKDENRMKLEEFVTNLRRVVGCSIDEDMMVGIYERVKANEFKDGNDHVSQVRKVELTIVGLKMMLALPHRRLVCYCRLYEVPDINKKEKTGVHQREVFLFNDLLVITKILSKKKNAVTYTFRQNFSLSGLHVSMFQTQYYQFGIQLMQRVDNQVLITFNARNDHDRTKFVEDIRESIMEMDEMENIRIEAELERQKSSRTNRCSTGNNTENRDSGVADVEVCQCLHGYPQSANSEHDAKMHHSTSEQSSGTLKRSALSNSLLDIHDQDGRPQRSGSVGSLDSGMSISFQSTLSFLRKDNSHRRGSSSLSSAAASATRNQTFLANFFTKGSSKGSSTVD